MQERSAVRHGTALVVLALTLHAQPATAAPQTTANNLLGKTPADQLRAIAAAQHLVFPKIDPPPADSAPTLAGAIARLSAAVDAASVASHRAMRGISTKDIAAFARDGTQPKKQPEIGTLTAAAVLMLDAVDRELAVLEAQPSSTANIDMCPTLAIDFGGDTRHPAFCRLIVDLGGDDVYTGAAGANRPGDDASLVVDLAGNDTYERFLEDDVVGAQGAGVGGVGVLVDVAGDDTYTAGTITAKGHGAALVAQGAGLLGVGVLADGGGRDTFRAETITVGSYAHVTAQGASIAGLGLLAHGPGSATYTAVGRANIFDETGTIYSTGAAVTIAQGGGELGSGALVDEDGDDAYELVADSPSAAVAIGQGGAVSNVEYSGAPLPLSQGPAVGVLVDGGGRDTHVLDARSEFRYANDFAATCPPGKFCDWTYDGHAGTNMVLAAGQGAGASTTNFIPFSDEGLPAVGVAVDLGDDPDTWDVFARCVFDVTLGLHNGGGGGVLNSFTTTLTVACGRILVYAHGSSDPGVGAFVAGEGDDRYVIVTRSETHATANAAGASTNTADASARSLPTVARVQGTAETGAAVLVEQGGDDTYDVDQTTETTAIENGAPGDTFPSYGYTTGRGYEKRGVALFVESKGEDDYSPEGGGGNHRCWTSTAMDTDDGSIPPGCLPLGAAS